MKTKAKAHFDGRRFHNAYPEQAPRGTAEIMKWLTTRKKGKWPKKEQVNYEEISHEAVVEGGCRVTFINHSTVFCEFNGFKLLFDPIWSKRCGPVRWLGVKRAVSPGIRFEDLPKIDAVLISHNHYDHLDLPTLKRLRKHDPQFIVPLGVSKLLKKNGIGNVFELDWWEKSSLTRKLEVHFVPAQHFSRRGAFDQNRTLWGGFIITWEKEPLYFAGDTAYGTHFQEIFERFGKLSLAMLPIGAYEPRWFMAPVHMSPKDAVVAHRELKPKCSLGIHFGTFPLGDEGYDDPVIDLKKALRDAHLSTKEFITLKNGESIFI